LATVVEGALVLAQLIIQPLGKKSAHTAVALRQSGSSNPPAKSQRNHIIDNVFSPLMSVQGSPIAELALRLKLPSIYADPLFAKAGGLMSYGARTLIAYSRISLPTSIRFSSAKPADLPVEQPSKFELIINLKTAKALGLDIPPNLLVLADEGDRIAESNVWL
jgi:hypothetical protein